MHARGMESYLIRERLQRLAMAQRARGLEVLSYDASGKDKGTTVAIARFLFGTTTRARGNGGTKEYRYPGFIEKDGVVWLGQSAFLLTPQRSAEVQAFLAGNGVAFGRLGVRVAQTAIL